MNFIEAMKKLEEIAQNRYCVLEYSLNKHHNGEYKKEIKMYIALPNGMNGWTHIHTSFIGALEEIKEIAIKEPTMIDEIISEMNDVKA